MDTVWPSPSYPMEAAPPSPSALLSSAPLPRDHVFPYLSTSPSADDVACLIHMIEPIQRGRNKQGASGERPPRQARQLRTLHVHSLASKALRAFLDSHSRQSLPAWSVLGQPLPALLKGPYCSLSISIISCFHHHNFFYNPTVKPNKLHLHSQLSSTHPPPQWIPSRTPPTTSPTRPLRSSTLPPRRPTRRSPRTATLVSVTAPLPPRTTLVTP